MWRNAFLLKFRRCDQGDFGYTHLRDAVYYASLDTEPKSFTWFLGKEEYEGQCAWSGMGNTNYTRPMDIYTASPIKDGTYPIDDLEIPCVSISAFGNNPGTTVISRVDLDNAITHGTKSKFLVLTSRVIPEKFIEEVKSHCRFTSYAQFFAGFEWTVKHRYEGKDSFQNRKDLLTKISGKVIKAQTGFDNVLTDYYTNIVGYGNGIECHKALPFTDDELVTFFVEEYTQRAPFFKNSAIYFLDERNLIDISRNSFIKHIDQDSKLYIGKLSSNSTLGTSFLICAKVDSKGAYLKMECDPGYERFKFTCISKLQLKKKTTSNSYRYATDTTVKLDFKLDIADLICNNLRRSVRCSQDDIPGQVLGIEHRDICDALNTIENTVFSNSGVGISIVPLSDEIESLNWADGYTKDISIRVSGAKLTKFFAIGANIEDYTHQSLTEFNVAVTSVCPGLFNKTAGHNQKLDSRKEELASKLAKLYEIFAEAIRLQIKLTLGLPRIDRPFILLNTETGSTNFGLYGNNNYSGIIDIPDNVSPGAIAQVMPDVDCMPFLFAIRALSKDWQIAEDELRKTLGNKPNIGYRTDMDAPYTPQRTLRYVKMTYERLCKAKGYDPAPQIGRPTRQKTNDEDSGGRLNFSVMHEGKKLQIDMGSIVSHQIFNLMIYAGFLSLIENDTFINIKGNPLALMTPYDGILSAIRDRQYCVWTIMRSMYAN